MKRTNLSWFVQLGAAMRPITEYRDPQKDPLQAYHVAQAQPLLKLLLDDKQMGLSLKAARSSIEELVNRLDKAMEAPDQKIREQQLKDQGFGIWHAAFDADRLLNAELAVQPTFHVWPKRAYDTDKLVNEADAIFSPGVQAHLSDQERYDIQQAGRCLAFEVPTAAVFHIFRAMESVLRRYYQIVTGTMPKPKMRNWGAYIKNLQQCKADPKILFALGEVKDMYRNPIMHPETKVGIEEALSLLGIADTVIGAMIEAIRAKSIADIIAKNPGGAVASLFEPPPG